MNIFYVAGLIEGEGCFGIYPQTRNPATKLVRIEVNMTDKSPLNHIQKLFGGKIYGPRKPKGKITYKPRWTWIIQRRETCFKIMQRLYPFLCARRRMKIRSILKHFNRHINLTNNNY